MIIGPKYKIARRLKAPIFEKTQTQKFAMREARKTKSKSRERPKTDYGLQMTEKQKARMFYGVSEKQFAKYVIGALAKKGASPATSLLTTLERRLDNVVWRAGLLPTHRAARQAVSHGHFLVNNKKVYVPSYSVKKGDVVGIRDGSKGSKMFEHLNSEENAPKGPAWLSWNKEKRELDVQDSAIESTELLFDLGQVIEFYQR